MELTVRSANRRVSFAPEATLHTWNVVELPEDSTTSSASTNSTRRASGLTANAGSPYRGPRSPMPSSDASEPPSTPPEQAEQLQVVASPARQRELHQKKRRRSSAIPPMNFNNPDEFSSSPYSGASDDTNQTFVTADEIDKDSDSSSNDDDLVEDETVNVDDNDTVRSTGDSSTNSSGRLEAALQQAAKQAGTQGIEYDEHGEITMEMADDEVTDAFKPWVKKGQHVPQVVGDPSALQDQENLNPFSPAFKANITKSSQVAEDGTMDITQAVGGILPAAEPTQSSPKRRRRKSAITGNQRRSSVAQRRSSGDSSVLGDEIMDLTTAIGGIQQNQDNMQTEDHADQSADDDEELTMEFTSVIGGVVQPNGKDIDSVDDQLANQQRFQDAGRRESAESVYNEDDMDITYAAGSILPPTVERTEPLEDQTLDMDITQAVGSILPKQLSTGTKSDAKILMEQETDIGQLSGSPFFGTPRQKPVGVGLTDERALPGHVKTMTSETGSPCLAIIQKRGSARKSTGKQSSVTPKSKQASPVKKPGTPSKQKTPQPTRPTTPGKTPPSKNVTMRTASPKKLFKDEIRAEARSAPNSTPRPSGLGSLFHHDAVTGATTPSIVLIPRRRRSSGLGVDREGLGSPRVTALLERRCPIGENARAFVAQGPAPTGVRFEDPQVMEQELDRERAEDQRRESGRGILQDEVDAEESEEKDATTNLRELIESLTPQKKKLNGRKSLHVGAAKGLLGKRPAELDDEEEEDGTPKRLKGREGSPVKKVKLPAPPPKIATTKRSTRSTRRSLAETAGNAQVATPSGTTSPMKIGSIPKDQPRYKDAESKSLANVQSFEQKLDGSVIGGVSIGENDRIHLQDFLNMTSIRFMELTTTKRRHTVVPNALLEQSAQKPSSGGEDTEQAGSSISLESCVVAGACTVPLLELYQHVSVADTMISKWIANAVQSCRELKNYISEGRSIVKEIEADTYDENPPLFREYMSAPPDVRPIMDNQFKNVKTHARLLSKATWYEWRMKLLEGLKEGLLKIGEGMDEDDRILVQEEQMMQPILPGLIEQHDNLERQVQIAQAQADEMANCDQDELKDARESLQSIDYKLETKQKLVDDLETQLREKENIVADVVERKQECLEEIKEAEKICQDCRGWSGAEVSALQGLYSIGTLPAVKMLTLSVADVDALEEAHGWNIITVAESAITMTYVKTLQLVFNPSSFTADAEPTARAENSTISLTYIADTAEYHAQALTTDKRFFLQIMRAQLQCLQQSHTKIKDLLDFVSSSWENASAIVEECRMTSVSYITEPTITSDEAMAVRSTILLQAMRTKVEVVFDVQVQSGDGVAALTVVVKPRAKVCYGEGLKEKKMAEFLESKIKDQASRGVWLKAMAELEERLLARGKKS